MRYYLDTEFDETEAGVFLISLGLVAENGRELYLESSDFKDSDCNSWIRDNVLPGLVRDSVNPPVPIAEMRMHVEAFLSEDPGPWKFWGYYCAYDWFLFCRLWGGMLRMPARMPKLCLDLKQVGEAVFPGISLKSVVAPEAPEHNALADARWNARLHAWLIARSAS